MEHGHEGAGHGPGPSQELGLERAFPCVRLRGLPFECTEEDIVTFLGEAGAAGAAPPGRAAGTPALGRRDPSPMPRCA